MSDTIEIQGAATIGYKEAAAWFAQADAEKQAFFFRQVAAIAAQTYEAPPVFQWHSIGREMADNTSFYHNAIHMLSEISSYIAENEEGDE